MTGDARGQTERLHPPTPPEPWTFGRPVEHDPDCRCQDGRPCSAWDGYEIEPPTLPAHELLRRDPDPEQDDEEPPPLPHETATFGDVVLILCALPVEAWHALTTRLRRRGRRRVVSAVWHARPIDTTDIEERPF